MEECLRITPDLHMKSDAKKGIKLEVEDRGDHGPTTGKSAIEEEKYWACKVT